MRGRPSHHACEFGRTGFPWSDDPDSEWAQPCGVQYHAQCIRAGAPFHTRLPNQQGLVYAWQAPAPHYVCSVQVVCCPGSPTAGVESTSGRLDHM
jgi:hypothetical protein